MVAVVLVNYNGASDTINCIKSLSNVPEIEFETIVVDNHSTDDSFSILKMEQKNYDFTLLESKDNKGFSAGNNIGIKYAQERNADYFLLLNNDTVVEPDFMKHLLEGFVVDKKCGLTTGRILYHSLPDTIWYAGGAMNRKTGRTEHFSYGEKVTISELTPQTVTFASGCCMCLSKALVDKVGMLNEDFFLYEEDAEYCYRIIDAGFSMIYVPSAVIYHKVSASTGQGSPMSQYYTIRNKYSLIRDNFKGATKINAYGYNTLQMLFRCMKKEMSFKCYRAAVRAFRNNEKGKVRIDL